MKAHKWVDFPVMSDTERGQPLLASQEMPSINLVPNVETGYIFASPRIKDRAEAHIGNIIKGILGSQPEG